MVSDPPTLSKHMPYVVHLHDALTSGSVGFRTRRFEYEDPQK